MDSRLISWVNCRSRIRTGLLPFGTLDSIALWAFLCFLSMTTGQELLLFLPDVVQTEGFVENRDSRELVPIQGAYPWFLCRSVSGNDTRRNQDCPESSSLIIHTRSTMISLNLLSINEAGVPRPISQQPRIQMLYNSSTTEEPTQDRRRNGVYNISVVSEAEIDEFTLTAFLGTSSRRINIRMDRVPPQVLEIQWSLRSDVEGPPRVSFLVRFNEEVFVNTNSATCQVDLLPLSNDHPADELVRRSEECNTNLLSTSFSEAFISSVPNNTLTAYSRSLRTGDSFYVSISALLIEDITTNVTLEIPVNSVLDRAGNRNNKSRGESVMYYQGGQDDTLEDVSSIVSPQEAPSMVSPDEASSNDSPEEPSQIVERWEPAFSSKDVGEASVVILVTSIVLSLTASIASSFVGGAISPGSMRMLSQAQKLHMTGRLAVVYMPFTYKNFTEQFGWAMFDTVGVSPDSSENAEDSSVEDPMLRIEEAPRIAYTNDREEHYKDYLNQIVFWMPLLLVILVFGHLIIVSLLFYYKKDIPSFFTFPRLEIMFGYFSTPIIATASAGLFQGDKDRERFIGLWMLIAFVFSFICFNIFVVWHTFYYTSVNERKANMFIDLGWHNDHESQFLSKAYKFLSKRFSNPNQTESNNPLRRILNLLRASRGQGDQQQGLDTQAPVPTTPPRSIELVTPPQTPSQFAVHIRERATTSAGCDRPSTSAEIEIAQSSTEADEEGETEYTTTTTYDRPYTTTTTTVSPQVDSHHEYKNLGECCYGCWDWSVLSKALGHPQPKGTWVGNKSDGNEFLAAYGYVFEEYRGPRVIREEATYSIDSSTGRVNRGFLVTVMEPPVLTFPCLCGFRCQVQRFHLQSSFRVIDLLKLVVMGCLVGSIDNSEDNEAQVIALLVVSCFMITLLRIARPFLNRIDMALGMFSEAADIFTFAMLLIILSTSPREDRRRFEQVGVAMMLVQCIVLAVMVLRYAVSTTSVTFTCASYIRSQNQQPQQNKLVRLIWRCHPTFLERKYFDQWVVKALHKGLNGRRVKASELPRSVAALRYFHELRNRLFRICSLKKQRI